jgi:hypothetical protein
MFTQVELISINQDVHVYWLQHDPQKGALIKAGRGVKILEEPLYLKINRVFTTLKNLSDLPPKVNIGTVVEFN